MVQIVKATEAVRSFSDIINRVYYKGESFDIQKGNNIVAKSHLFIQMISLKKA